MIFKGLGDTEDWTPLLKIQLCHHRNKYNFKIYGNKITIFTVFLVKMNATFFSLRNFFQKC